MTEDENDVKGTFCPITRWMVAIVAEKLDAELAKPEGTRKWATSSEFAARCYPCVPNKRSAASQWIVLRRGSRALNRIPLLPVFRARIFANVLGMNLSDLVAQAELRYRSGMPFPQDVAWDKPLGES